MTRQPDVIGIGAQKAATSWIYACLYEHPELCFPYKELHFFSRERNWSRGREWYESHFAQCSADMPAGEFSTSYLPDENAPERIHSLYPRAKLIACLRNPADRAYSNYLNDIKSGTIPEDTVFSDLVNRNPKYLDRGRYALFLQRWLKLFPRRQTLFLVYDDCRDDPAAFIRSIFTFLEVSPDFVPGMLHQQVNPEFTPRSVSLEKFINRASETLQGSPLRNLWWTLKKSGLPGKLRALNSRPAKKLSTQTDDLVREIVAHKLRDDIEQLESILGRTLPGWKP